LAFQGYLLARTKAKAFAINPAGRCSRACSVISAEDAKREVMRRCTATWGDCALYAVGQSLAQRSH